MFDRNAYLNKIAWHKQARFGMFIHFGLYSIPAKHEWLRSVEQMPLEEYQPYFNEFNPIVYDPKIWAKLAKKTGMKYAILTAKHHDGFCLFNTRYTDYNVMNTPYGKDIIKEYVEAFREEGIKVGLYYSLLDWHHEDYPHYGDRVHPDRQNEKYKDTVHNFESYVEYMHNQIVELCTNYGIIDMLWFDYSYDNLRGEAWHATELVRKIRKLQPNVIIDNRLEVSGEGFGSLLKEEPSEYAGDYLSPEQIIPPHGIVDEIGRPVHWEACITMNNHWSYCQSDNNYKPASMIIRKLVECVSKGGNLLLNVGPTALGEFPEPSINILEQIAVWMNKNSQSIYGCDTSRLEKPEFGRITQNGKFLYFHIIDNPIGYIALEGIKKEDVKRIRLLHDMSEIKIEHNWVTNNYPDILFISLGENPVLPDTIDTVVMVELY